MSVDKNYYVIGGYDLTNYITDKYEDWQWTDEGEKYLCGLKDETVHLINDPMSDEFLYLGHVFAKGDEYYFKTTKLSVGELFCKNTFMQVYKKLEQLIEAGVIDEKAKSEDYGVIIFEQCY